MGVVSFLVGLPEHAPLFHCARHGHLYFAFRALEGSGPTRFDPRDEADGVRRRVEETLRMAPEVEDLVVDLMKRHWQLSAVLRRHARATGHGDAGRIVVEGELPLDGPRATGSQGVRNRWTPVGTVPRLAEYLEALRPEDLRAHVQDDRPWNDEAWANARADLAALRELYRSCAERRWAILVGFE